MSRKSSKRTRIDGMSQFKQRAYKRKNSPKSRKDSRDWAYFAMKKIQKEATNETASD